MSSFDPFKLYRKTYKQSHHGQILQKKPVERSRAYSQNDLKEAYKVLDAYQIPYGITPAPPKPFEFPTYTIVDTFTSDYKTLNQNTPVNFIDNEFYSNFMLSDFYEQLVSLAETHPDQVYQVSVQCSFPVLSIRTYTAYSGMSASYQFQFPQIQSSSVTPSYPITANVGSPSYQRIPFAPSSDTNVIYSAPLYVGQQTQQTVSSFVVNSSKSLMSFNTEDLPLSLLVSEEAFDAAFGNTIFSIVRTSVPLQSVTFAVAINYNITVTMAPVIDN